MGKSFRWTEQGRQKLSDLVERKCIKVVNEAKRNAPVDRGGLRSSLRYNISFREDLPVGVVGSNLPYARALEFGTRPFTPPLKPLMEWGERVLGDESAGAAVWQKIRQNGISPQPFLIPAIDKVLSNR